MNASGSSATSSELYAITRSKGGPTICSEIMEEPWMARGELTCHSISALCRSSAIAYHPCCPFLGCKNRRLLIKVRWSSGIKKYMNPSGEHARMLSRFSRVRLCNLRTVARQALLSMGFSRQEYWTGLPCPPPGDLPDPGMEPTSLRSPALADGSLPLASRGKPK